MLSRSPPLAVWCVRVCVCVCVVLPCLPATAFATLGVLRQTGTQCQPGTSAPLEPPPTTTQSFSFRAHYSTPSLSPPLRSPSLLLLRPPSSLLAGRRRISPFNTNHLKTISRSPFFPSSSIVHPLLARHLATRYCECATSSLLAANLSLSLSLSFSFSLDRRPVPPSSRLARRCKLSSMLDDPLRQLHPRPRLHSTMSRHAFATWLP